jgi:hypothetical protein
MKHSLTLIVILLCTHMCVGQSMNDPAQIEVYITPYYNSTGPAINIGTFSKGLAASNESEFVETISKMKVSWDSLKFTELYVASICLYNRGFRKESVYWFYAAQYRGRLLASLLDQQKKGGIGDPGFELFHAVSAFQQLVGPYINGYAFGNIDHLIPVIEKVQKEGKTIPDMNKIYPNLSFKKKTEWEAINKEINEGLGKMLARSKDEKAKIKEQRIANGIEDQFSKLTSKELIKGPIK